MAQGAIEELDVSIRGRLLLKSPDAMTRMLLGNFLRGLGYEVELAADGLGVLGVLAQFEPELVVEQRVASADSGVAEVLTQAGLEVPIVVLAAEQELTAVEATAALAWPSPRPVVAATVERVLADERTARISNQAQVGDRDTIPAPPLDDEGEQKVGRFVIEALVGRGGMSDVYRCRDPLDDRVVAVKTLRCPLCDDLDQDPVVQRFKVEAAALARLLHPRIVATHQFGVDERGGVMFLVMQYVDGPSLRHRLERGVLPAFEAMRVTWEIADALAHAHARGVVHRDVKPENILLNELGQPLLTDFGLARLGNFSVSNGQMIAGTPVYMAPEQVLDPRRVDARADQFGLGAMMLEMLTGAACLDDVADHSSILGILNARRPTLVEAGVDAPTSLQQLIGRMMASDPEDRFVDDEELLVALDGVARQLGLFLERL